jgi:hypothetical protein
MHGFAAGIAPPAVGVGAPAGARAARGRRAEARGYNSKGHLRGLPAQRFGAPTSQLEQETSPGHFAVQYPRSIPYIFKIASQSSSMLYVSSDDEHEMTD